MDKLSLALTFVVFLSGVLCGVPQNLVKGAESNDTQPLNVINLYQLYFCNGTVVPMNRAFGELTYTRGSCTGAPVHKLHKRLMYWNEARKSCISARGQLVVINSNAEGEMLVNWMKKEGISTAWIGTHDRFKDYDWVTLTGQTLEAAGYDNWLPGEPSNSKPGEHCGALEDKNGMNDVPCNRLLPYFCKIYVS